MENIFAAQMCFYFINNEKCSVVDDEVKITILIRKNNKTKNLSKLY
jgi:hypothetical protein